MMDLIKYRKGCERVPALLGWRYTAGIQRWTLLGIMGLAAVIIMGCVNYDSPPQSSISYEPLTCLQPLCEEVAVERGDITLSVETIGIVRSNREDYVAPARGRVAHVDVSAGDIVQKGQVLVSLDPTPLELAVVRARIALLEAEGSFENLMRLPTSEASEKAQSLVLDTHKKVESAKMELELAQGELTPQQVTRISTGINVAEIMVTEALRQLEVLTRNPSTQGQAEAHQARSNAGVALKEAEEALRNLARDHTRQLMDARRAKAEAEDALIRAEQALRDFGNRDQTQRFIDARRAKIEAEVRLQRAERALSDFHFSYPRRDQDSLDLMMRLQEEVDLARTELDIALEELVHLQERDALRPQQLEVAVALAKSDLKFAEESLAHLDRVPDPQDIASIKDKLAVTTGELKLIQQALEALDRQAAMPVGAGFEGLPDDRALLQARAAALQDDLALANSALAAIEAGVHPDEVALLQATIIQARNELTAAAKVVDNVESAPSTSTLLALREVREALTNLDLTSRSTPEGVQHAQLELATVESKLLEVSTTLKSLEGTSNQLDLELRRKMLEVAREELAEAEENLQYATIVAPFDGIVSALNVEKGQRVNAGDLMVQVLDPSAPAVVAQIRAIDMPQVQKGQDVSFTVGEFSDRALGGQVARISSMPIIPAQNLQTGVSEPTYEVVISSEALRSAGLIEGMHASVSITIDQRRDVLLVPVSVLNGRSDDKPVVEVANGGSAALVNITLGLKNNHFVEVKDGLREGDVVRVHRGSTRDLHIGDSVKEPSTDSLVVSPSSGDETGEVAK